MVTLPEIPDSKIAQSRVDLSPVSRALIDERVKGCARLPSLRSIDSALRELLNSDRRYTHQISEIIRRDPSLTARLLRLVNSVYFGLSTPVNNITIGSTSRNGRCDCRPADKSAAERAGATDGLRINSTAM